MLRAAGVYIAWCTSIKTPDNKFVICIEPQRRWFFVINSEPRRLRPDVQLKMAKRDFPNLLTHDSFLDAGLPRYISPAELDNRLKTESWRDKGELDQRNILRILVLVENSKYLSQEQQEAISSSLRGVFVA